MDGYSTSSLAKISGISADQLKRWDTAGLLCPARILKARGEATERRYTRDQALGVIALAELRRGGVSARRIRAASALLPPSLSDYPYIVFDGWLMYPKMTDAEVVKLLKQIPQGARVLEVGPLAERLS